MPRRSVTFSQSLPASLRQPPTALRNRGLAAAVRIVLPPALVPLTDAHLVRRLNCRGPGSRLQHGTNDPGERRPPLLLALHSSPRRITTLLPTGLIGRAPRVHRPWCDDLYA